MIRELTLDDFDDFYTIRRLALLQNPEAFGTKLADFDARPQSQERGRFEENVRSNDHFILGAFQDGRIVGMTGFRRETTPGFEQTGQIWGVFVAPDARGRGFGRQLIDGAADRARQIPNLSRLRLSVVRVNLAAITLYEQCGFQPLDPTSGDPLLDGACSSELHMALNLE